jgi:cellulose biosynthesis protein BcsQ
MAKRIALFNHKGGVSKTTTVFNIGWMLASKGKKVVIVDTDPQCNLTGLVLGYKGSDEFENFYQNESGRNIRDGLSPAFESRPKLIDAVECIPVKGREGLFLLPGHIKLAEYEVTLGIAQELSGSIQTLQNLPGCISYLLNRTAEKYEAEYILIDMSPSLSSINQNLLMTSDYFIVPTNPGYFSVMAIDSLATILPRWRDWAKQAGSMQILRDATYPFPEIIPKFLGTVVQKYQVYSGSPASAFRYWIENIETAIVDKLVPKLRECNMILPEKAYTTHEIKDYCLASIPDFKSLIAKSEKMQTPVFALTPEQIGEAGVVLDKAIESRDRFNQIHSDLVDKIIGLIDYESSNRTVPIKS